MGTRELAERRTARGARCNNAQGTVFVSASEYATKVGGAGAPEQDAHVDAPLLCLAQHLKQRQ